MFPASGILEQIIETLVAENLLTTKLLKMLTCSNLTTFRFSWLETEQITTVKGDYYELDETLIRDILNAISVICPVCVMKFKYENP